MEAIYINTVGNIITIRPDTLFLNRFIRASSHTSEMSYTQDEALKYLLYWEYELVGYV